MFCELYSIFREVWEWWGNGGSQCVDVVPRGVIAALMRALTNEAAVLASATATDRYSAGVGGSNNAAAIGMGTSHHGTQSAKKKTGDALSMTGELVNMRLNLLSFVIVLVAVSMQVRRSHTLYDDDIFCFGTQLSSAIYVTLF